MGIPVEYRTGGEGAVASYDSTELASGTGIVQQYGLRGKTMSGSNVFYAIIKDLTYTDEENGGVIRDDEGAVNFDTPEFNLPQIMKGTLYLTGEVISTGDCWVRFIPQKVSKGTATELAPYDETPSVGANTDFFIKFDIPSTKFKKGDVFRIVAEVYGGTGLNGLSVNSEHVTNKPFKIYLPFRIDL